MQVLDRPAAGDQPGRQPVEQLGMSSAARPGCRSSRASPRFPGRNDAARSRLTITRAVRGWSGRVIHSRQLAPSAGTLGTRWRGEPCRGTRTEALPRDDGTGPPGISASLNGRVLRLALRDGIGGGDVRRQPVAAAASPAPSAGLQRRIDRTPARLRGSIRLAVRRVGDLRVEGLQSISQGLGPGAAQSGGAVGTKFIRGNFLETNSSEPA